MARRYNSHQGPWRLGILHNSLWLENIPFAKVASIFDRLQLLEKLHADHVGWHWTLGRAILPSHPITRDAFHAREKAWSRGTQVAIAELQLMPKMGYAFEISHWTTCSATCGGGSQQRTASRLGLERAGSRMHACRGQAAAKIP